jgi:hypothetical protein
MILVGRGSARAGDDAPPPARTEPRPVRILNPETIKVLARTMRIIEILRGILVDIPRLGLLGLLVLAPWNYGSTRPEGKLLLTDGFLDRPSFHAGGSLEAADAFGVMQNVFGVLRFRNRAAVT